MNDEVYYTVTDTLAVRQSRQHLVELENGALKPYDLSASEPTKMPVDHAMKFLCDEKFIVKDENGKTLKPLAKVEQATNVIVPAGFVLAEWSELTRDSLYKRAKLLKGSEHIHAKKTSTEALIFFLRSNLEDKPLAPDVDNDAEVGEVIIGE